MTQDRRRTATALGCVAIALWSALALLTAMARGIPPFELLTLGFAVAFLAGLGLLAARGRAGLSRIAQPPGPWIVSFLALFLFHALYFIALADIPPARASLIAYLWPLLIVMFAALAPSGAGLKPRHLVGAALGLAGVALISLGHRAAAVDPARAMPGYLAAVGSAIVWASYSVTNRRFAAIPSEMLVGVCGAVSLAGAVVHLLLEPSVWPDARQWSAIALLGIGPTGLAFFAWDHATKHGDVPLLGALAYLAPLASTVLLVLAGQASASLGLGMAVVLIVSGAAIASRRPAPAAAPQA